MSVSFNSFQPPQNFMPAAFLSSIMSNKMQLLPYMQDSFRSSMMPQSQPSSRDSSASRNVNSQLKKKDLEDHLTKWGNSEVGQVEFTNIEGFQIVCFNVWGEKRLLIPQLLRCLLNDFDMDKILSVINELQLTCGKANDEQVYILHQLEALPKKATSCGLIRQSDAERLCKVLLHQEALDDIEGKQENVNLHHHSNKIAVMHCCFGKQTGYFLPNLYTCIDAKCIQCDYCNQLLSPSTFVGHTHQKEETSKVTHWGFDSNHWRSYLRICVDKNSENALDLEKQLQKEKEKFLPAKKNAGETSTVQYKWIPKIASTSVNKLMLPPPPKLFMTGSQGPLPENLQTGPPVLANPENVIPLSMADKFDRDFSPNVCLAAPVKRCRSPSGDRRTPTPVTPSRKPEIMVPKVQPKAVDSGMSAEAIGLQVMQDILYGRLNTDSERARLLEHYVAFQRASKLQLEAALADKRKLNQLLFEERARASQNRDQVTRARTEAADYIRLAQKRENAIAEERDQLLKNIREASCPDVHKIRAKYAGIKSELDQMTTERDQWEFKYKELRIQLDQMSQSTQSSDQSTPCLTNAKKRKLDIDEDKDEEIDVVHDTSIKKEIICEMDKAPRDD